MREQDPDWKKPTAEEALQFQEPAPRGVQGTATLTQSARKCAPGQASALPDQGSWFRYFAASAEESRWGLTVSSVGTSSIRPGSVYPPPVHPAPYDFNWTHGRALPGYHMVFLSAGAGWYQWGHESRRVIEAGDVFFVFANEWHRYAPDPRTGWDEHWVGFEGPRVEAFLANGFMSLDRHIVRARSTATVLRGFQMLRETAIAGLPGLQPTLAGLCEYVLAQVHGSTLPCDADHADVDQLVERVIRVLTERVTEKVDIEALADELGVSSRSLRRSFAQHTGMGPHQYHVELRLALARQLLCNPDLSVKEVAFKSGYLDEHYFSRLFHQKMGMTPSDWKTRMRDHGTADPPAGEQA